MQARQLRSQPRSVPAVESLRRIASGESTSSRESSLARDSTYDTDITRFQPIAQRPVSQSASQYSNHSAYSNYSRPDTGAVAALQDYAGVHGTFVDPRAHQNQVQPQYGTITEAHNNPYYAPVMNGNVTYMPIQQEGRSGTPQLGANGTDGERKDKKAVTSTAANEKELRELLENNEHRDLDSIARDVRQAERTQKSERAKQLFAMRWLREFCKQDTDSVPRNRVYTHYTQRCGTDRVDTLNAASFGKLVRIIFPGIQTRRLGVRGESKYHYVNLRLLDDPQASMGRPSSSHNLYGERAGSYEPDLDLKPYSRLPVDSATFPPQENTNARQPSPSTVPEPGQRAQPYMDQPQIPVPRPVEESYMYTKNLKFSPAVIQSGHDEAMTLPNIFHFVPFGTDRDLTDALSALYRTHCTSIVDAVRYVKQKSFFRMLGAFNGKLTVPVSKLFAHISVASWIKMCDILMYQQIVRFLSQLTLQVIPPQVFLMLKEIANTLPDTMRKNFSNYPGHVIQAKVEPATVFANLLNRLLRVNEAAHAAANFLINDQIRNIMWNDWAQHVQPKRVLESELPSCGYEEAFRIMTVDMRSLLEPLDRTSMAGPGSDLASGLFTLDEAGNEQLSFDSPTAETIMERWAKFLEELPNRFPQAHARLLLHTMNAVTTAALRDITVNQAQSFGSWWITKVWVDEMMLWQAEMGGFLATGLAMPSGAESPNQPPYAMFDARSSTGSSGDGRQPTSHGLDFQQIPQFLPSQASQLSRPATATFSFQSNGEPIHHGIKHELLHDDHDDSGIGMSLLSNDADGLQYNFIN